MNIWALVFGAFNLVLMFGGAIVAWKAWDESLPRFALGAAMVVLAVVLHGAVLGEHFGDNGLCGSGPMAYDC